MYFQYHVLLKRDCCERRVNMRKIAIAALLIFVISAIGCIHIEPSHFGTVKDGDSSKPISDVNVYAVFEYMCLFPLSPGGKDSEPLGNVETTTDKTGYYKLPSSIYFMNPFNICSYTKEIGFIKPGYAEYSYHLGFPWDNEIPDPQQIRLYKFSHYFDILPYLRPEKYLQANTDNLPKNYLQSLDQMKLIKFFPTDKKGIFFRIPGKELSRIYHPQPVGDDIDIYYVYDERSQDWIFIDNRGHMHREVLPKMSKWLYMGDYKGKNKYEQIYANKNDFYYYTEVKPTYEIKNLSARKGDISDVAGYPVNFISIENGNNNLCVYGIYLADNVKKIYEAKDLPNYNVSTEFNNAKFVSISKYGVEYGSYNVVVKGKDYWHCYVFNVFTKKFTELWWPFLTIPSSKDIVDIIPATLGTPFIVYKDDGFASYEIIHKRLNLTQKYNEFNYSFKGQIKSISIDYGYIYATAGDDRIFRFNLDGESDYPIEIIP